MPSLGEVRLRAASPWRWLESHPVWVLAAAMVLAVCLRLPFLGAPMQPDEGGFLMVAKQWDTGGSWLYGSQWVDRPPFLIVVFRFASLFGSSVDALRLVSMALGLCLVASAWWAGRSIGGARGAIVGAMVGAAVGSAYLLDGYGLVGEGIAATFVMLSCALVLHARLIEQRERVALALAVGAGLAAGLAFLTKQNFVDAGIFGAFFLGLDLPRSWRLLVAEGVGIVVPLGITAGWAQSASGPGISALWTAIFTFREKAAGIIASSAAPVSLNRLKGIVVIAVISGIVLLAWQVSVAIRRADSLVSLRVALVAMFGYAVFSMVFGGNWWRHYLLQLTPVLVLGAALATRRADTRFRIYLSTLVAAFSAVLVSALLLPAAASDNFPAKADTALAGWLRAASEPRDSVIIFYGEPNIIEMSGLSTPYPYSWSLPLRARDPRLRLLVRTMRGPHAPTWLVRIDGFDRWGIETPQFASILQSEYHQVTAVCGHEIWLHDGDFRQLPPSPSHCGAQATER